MNWKQLDCLLHFSTCKKVLLWAPLVHPWADWQVWTRPSCAIYAFFFPTLMQIPSQRCRFIPSGCLKAPDWFIASVSICGSWKSRHPASSELLLYTQLQRESDHVGTICLYDFALICLTDEAAAQFASLHRSCLGERLCLREVMPNVILSGGFLHVCLFWTAFSEGWNLCEIVAMHASHPYTLHALIKKVKCVHFEYECFFFCLYVHCDWLVASLWCVSRSPFTHARVQREY